LPNMENIKRESEISFDYIRGLVDGEGTFTFSSNNKRQRTKIPAFSIKMHARDKELLVKVRNAMNLKNNIYEYNYQGKDGSKRGPQAMLIVREFGQLKNIVVPFFYKKLIGNKGKQFEEWIEKIGTDPDVPKSYKFIYRIYKLGFYDRNPKF